MAHLEEDPQDTVHQGVMVHQDIILQVISLIPDITLLLGVPLLPDMVLHGITLHMVHQGTGLLLVEAIPVVVTDPLAQGTVVVLDTDPLDTGEVIITGVGLSGDIPVGPLKDQGLGPLQECITHPLIETPHQDLVLSRHTWGTQVLLHLVVTCLQMIFLEYPGTRDLPPEYYPLALNT